MEANGGTLAGTVDAEGRVEATVLEFAASVSSVRLTLFHPDGVKAIGFGPDGTTYEPVYGGTPGNPVLTLHSPSPNGLKGVALRAPIWTSIYLFEVRVPGGPEMTRHIADELARWSQQGEVLEPYTDYRLAVTTRLEARGEGGLAGYARDELATELAYFRTGGPPGCEAGGGVATPGGRATGLEDLARYVRETMPAAAAGPRPPRPVYRTYDVGVEFNENYTELMYRRARRDLQLYLHDNNGPARDEAGRIIVLDNQWGQSDTLTLTEGEERWLLQVQGSACIPAAPITVRRDTRLLAAATGQLLAPATPYEARLAPLLRREDFAEVAAGDAAVGTGASLGQWRVADVAGGPSRWVVREAGDPPSRSVAQRTAATTLLVLHGDHGELAAQWTSYRLSAYLAAPPAGAAGVAFRVRDAANFYLVSYRAEPGGTMARRQLVRVAGGTPDTLAEDVVEIVPGADVQVSVEAVGTRLRVYQRASAAEPPALVFDVTDATHDRGAPALYSEGNGAARFGDIRVDDFRDSAPVVYRFHFATSRYADFFHQVHSFPDQTWIGPLPANADVAALLAAAADPSSPVLDAEARAHDALAALLGPDGSAPRAVQATRVTRNGTTLAYRVQSPEPLAWDRIALAASATAQAVPVPTPSGSLKLTGVTFGASHPNEETISILAREPASLAGLRVEYRALAEPGAPAAPWQPYYVFDENVRLAAGRRVRVYGGSEAEAPAPEPHVLRRFAAPAGGPGSLRLDGGGVELRLVARGATLHARAFLPGHDFAPLGDARVLRNADGTSFFLVRQGGALAPGTHRVRLTFRRDNRLADPRSPVLSAGGDSTAEHATIDLPW